jgi:hypothetical protein
MQRCRICRDFEKFPQAAALFPQPFPRNVLRNQNFSPNARLRTRVDSAPLLRCSTDNWKRLTRFNLIYVSLEWECLWKKPCRRNSLYRTRSGFFSGFFPTVVSKVRWRLYKNILRMHITFVVYLPLFLFVRNVFSILLLLFPRLKG